MVGISHNAQNTSGKKTNQFIIMTNKGKKIIVTTYVFPNNLEKVASIS